MKTSTKFLCVILFLMTTTLTQAQNYYVIIGAFTNESMAQKFNGYVRSLQYDAKYELNNLNNLFYVYILKSTNHDEAIALAKNLQAESEFKDAWVFEGKLGAHKEEEQPPVAEITQPIIEKPELAADSMTQSLSVAPVISKDSATAITEPGMVKGKLFEFLIETSDGRPIQAEVHQVDFNRGRDLATFKGNQYIDILNPMKNNPMTIVCGVFGYKEVVQAIDYTDPSFFNKDAKKDQHDAWVIPFKLERMKKGDVSVMYHVSFYKDAVIMSPGSKSEMDELVNMMKDNPNYKIKIHGHCNGKNERRIIALGPTKNYFDVKGSDEIKGTAKELSKMRAEAVQSYLADNGIDKSRSEIYAWGALNMLVDEHSNSSRLNDRIEIEIMED